MNRFKFNFLRRFLSERPVLLFALRFGALMAVFYAVGGTKLYAAGLNNYLKVNAWLSSGVLRMIGVDCHVAGTKIWSKGLSISVGQGCDAVEPSWMFFAAVLAFPARVARKFGLSVGATIVGLQFLNVLRIVSLFEIGLHFPAGFRVAHGQVWPVVFILVIIVSWIVWVAGSSPDEQHP